MKIQKYLEPYLIATMDDIRFETEAGYPERIVETINREFDGKIGIRTTVGDPTSYKEVEVSLLKNIRPLKRLYIHHAHVQGKSYFPDDMLRYDFCQIDVMSDDVIEIYQREDGIFFKEDTKIYICQVSLGKMPCWREGRWRSMGWVLTPTITKVYTKDHQV